ncbi:DMT family transporter [Cytobacillus oceanisediminis]|uniref:Antibiotic transporter n=1 Tax=Cytobacillus oceanisediminis TaxID=665099 RepID=A0ABX3CQ23_9BACI|nr:DMT family transporter [Cytobacillus oceanisediminis]OHX45981.1 antibiotic transporter [Cytobacillus oceanisediminis]
MLDGTNKKYGFLMLILANMIWGGNFVIGRIGVDYFPPLLFSLMRWIIAFLLLTPFMVKKLKSDWNIIWQHKRILLLLAVTGVAGYNTIIYFALQYTTSINASVVNSTTPLFIAILAIFILREKLLAHQAAGILLSVFGILYIISKGSIEVFLSWSINAGDLYVLAAVIMWASYSVIGKKYSNVLPVLTSFYASTFIGILLLVPLSLIEYLVLEKTPVFTLTSAGILLYVGFLASIMAFLSWNFGVSLIGAAKAGVFLNLLPIFAIIFALCFTEEKLYLYQIIGGGIVTLGVVISSKKSLGFKNHVQENKSSA